jgi:hypothetical protein
MEVNLWYDTENKQWVCSNMAGIKGVGKTADVAIKDFKVKEELHYKKGN